MSSTSSSFPVSSAKLVAFINTKKEELRKQTEEIKKEIEKASFLAKEMSQKVPQKMQEILVLLRNSQQITEYKSNRENLGFSQDINDKPLSVNYATKPEIFSPENPNNPKNVQKFLNVFSLMQKEQKDLLQKMQELINMAALKEKTEKDLCSATAEQARHIEEVNSIYGSFFCKAIGHDIIYDLPVVAAEKLDLTTKGDEKYPSNVVKPSMLENHPAVRGIMGKDRRRPFIAIKTDVTDLSGKKTYTVVELIFKRYSGDLEESNYVTALSNITEEKKEHNTNLYGTDGMVLQAVKELLGGNVVDVPLKHMNGTADLSPIRQIKMSSPVFSLFEKPINSLPNQ